MRFKPVSDARLAEIIKYQDECMKIMPEFDEAPQVESISICEELLNTRQLLRKLAKA